MKSTRKAARKLFVAKMIELQRYIILDYVYNINVLEYDLAILRPLI
jgi:hypothetical protein